MILIDGLVDHPAGDRLAVAAASMVVRWSACKMDTVQNLPSHSVTYSQWYLSSHLGQQLLNEHKVAKVVCACRRGNGH